MALQSRLKIYTFSKDLTRQPMSSLAESMVRAQEEMRVEDTVLGRSKKRQREADAKPNPKKSQDPPKRRMSFTTKLSQSQTREVYQALQASSTLPKPMRQVTLESHKGSGKFFQYH